VRQKTLHKYDVILSGVGVLLRQTESKNLRLLLPIYATNF
jgi:hypothetical protein